MQRTHLLSRVDSREVVLTLIALEVGQNSYGLGALVYGGGKKRKQSLVKYLLT